MGDCRRGLFRRALSDRPDEVKESLFFVKVKKNEQTQGRGIACAVQAEVRGQTKYFLITDTDVKTDRQGEVFAQRCYKRWPWSSRKKVYVESSSEDSSFSFIPRDGPPKGLKLISLDNIDNQLKKQKCRSFVATQKSLKTCLLGIQLGNSRTSA